MPLYWDYTPEDDCGHWPDREVVGDDGRTLNLCTDCGRIEPAE
jgi:hypothetical protein